MKKILLALSLLFLCRTASAETTKTVFNPFTGKPDFITALSSTTLPSGSTRYIQNTSSLQSGATFYVSSGTVNTSLSLPYISTGSVLALNSSGVVVSTTIPSGNFINNAATLQSGATFYVSSGTATNFNASNITVSGITAGATGVQLNTLLDASAHNWWLKMQRSGLYGIGFSEDVGGYVSLSDLSNNELLFSFPEGIPHATYMMVPGAGGKATVGAPVSDYSVLKARLTVNAEAADIGVIVKGASSQTGDLQQWRNSSSVALSSVTASGNFVVNGITSNSFTVFGSTTVAGIAGTTPQKTGEVWYLSNGTNCLTCISTATVVGSYSCEQATNRTTACQ